ncbi:hypothetical protein MKW94_025201 [Papaver nudicaule]|uniref:Transmembrane protein n=1 Tax=Papaver nudicaule TaxID=74823 RepID=A0AA41SHB1_PAPNU|nr:hypothetical protein [Papaver nudicaule]
MALASSQQSFLTNTLVPSVATHRPKSMSFFLSSSTIVSSKLSSNNNQHDPSSSPTRNKNEMKLAKMALVALVAGALTLGSVHDEALAAKSGGRIGGQEFRSSAPRPSAPRASGPRINNSSRTNIYINPGIAPPLGGYGYGGYAVPYYGGYGFSPFSLIGFGGGFELFGLALFLGAAAAVVRRFTGSSRSDDEDDY